jgi:hypothetical protein
MFQKGNKKYLKHKWKDEPIKEYSMKAILRIFKYCRKRIIKLSIENRKLKLQLKNIYEPLKSG